MSQHYTAVNCDINIVHMYFTIRWYSITSTFYTTTLLMNASNRETLGSAVQPNCKVHVNCVFAVCCMDYNYSHK